MIPHIFAALVNLDQNSGRYVHWHWIQISVANLIVIGLMLVVFVLALVLPFPHHGGTRASAVSPGQVTPENEADEAGGR
ncbi:MAG: hypothetical protein ACLQK4_03545 [Acidimicrobiales bacterium]